MKTINIGLFGFGCVGEGFYQIASVSNKINVNFEKIIIKNLQKPRNAPAYLFSNDPGEVFESPKIDLIVELINGTEEAFNIVSTAIKSGVPVVSANKKMLATYFTEIQELIRKYKTPLLYEGAVCGAIPILRTIDHYYQYDQINQLEGIFNGTTNYILTQQFEENRNFEDTLKDAQRLGFAELDASSDIDAFDPKYKLKILAAHAFGIDVPEGNILNLGIRNINEKDIIYAKNKGLKYRLLSKVIRKNNQICLFVLPVLVNKGNVAFNIDNENNFVSIGTEFAENHLLVGKGAGSQPTGAAVYSDVLGIVQYNFKYNLPENDQLNFTNKATIEVFVSGANPASLKQVELDEEYQVFESLNYYYKTGKINIEKLVSANNTDLFIGMISDKVEFQVSEESFATI